MELDATFAIIFRFAIAVVYFYIFHYFYKGYTQSVKNGFKNYFFIGFSILFFILSLFSIVYGGYELYTNLTPNFIDMKNNFPGEIPADPFIKTISHQLRPAYIIFYFLMNLVVATLVFPLEQAIGWKKGWATKIIILFGASLWLIFIPALTYTIFSLIPLVLGFTGIGIGFLLNIAVNMKLFKDSAGEIRRRSLYAILAFIFLAIGLVWSMEVMWGEAINEAITNKWDVVIGCCIQAISILFYRMGFGVSFEK